MKYDMVKYERGQIWIIRWKNPTYVGREQAKDRPWLILSVGKFNQTSGMFTAVPITSRSTICTPAQVLFTNDSGKYNVILCEQIRTFDYKSGEYILDYLGNISNDILEKVDVALSVHLGLHYSPITLKSLYDSMEAVVKSIGHLQKNEDSKKFTDDDILEFADKLQMLASTGNGVKESIFEESPEFVIDTVERKDTNTIPKQDSLNSMVKVTSKKRIKWTLETCKEFLEDSENLPMKQVMEKWGISKKPRFYSMKHYAQSVLTKNE